MKRIIYCIPVLALLFGCVKEMDTDVRTYDCFYAVVEEDEDATKAHFEQLAVKWDSGDKIGVFSNTQTTALTFTRNSSGSFTSSNGIGGSTFYAFYPSSASCNGSARTVTFSSPGPAFDKKTIDMPMVATGNGNTLTFKQTCGVLHFHVTGSGNYTKVTLKGNNNESIYGSGTVSLTDATPVFQLSGLTKYIEGAVPTSGINWKTGVDVYFVLPPMTLSNGFTLTVLTGDNKELSKQTTKSVTISRGKMTRYVLNLDDLDGAGDHEYVDLGLSVKWATTNIGASKPEENGDYFAWGETEPKSNYNWSTYKWCNGSYNSLTKYNTSNSYGTVDNKTVLELGDDAARVKWGGSWRMPTKEEFDELKNQCNWVWTTQGGKNGYRITGPSGDSIFLPAAGFLEGTSLKQSGTYGLYWSSYSGNNLPHYAYYLYFRSGYVNWDLYYRYNGRSVRPVISITVPVQSVSLNTNSITISVGDEYTLKATVSPSNASNKNVTWKSGDSNIAEVDKNGKVTARSIGATVITVTTEDGKKTATCNVTVIMKAPDFVDLGLSVKWGTFNLGATKPEETGSYYSWGELAPKSNYIWGTYSLCYSQTSMKKYTTSDGLSVLEASDDAARSNLGGNWRLPTKSEWEQLLEKCTWEWKTNYNGTGANGYLVTSKINGYEGCSIFLPTTGRYTGTSKMGSSTDGKYWSSTLHSDYQDSAFMLDFDNENNHSVSYSDRYLGLAIRPVCPFSWNYLGKGTLTDGALLPLFGDEDVTVACDVYQEVSLPGEYIVTGFQLELAAAFYGVKTSELESYEGENGNWYNALVYINATNPNAVFIDHSAYGIYVNSTYGYVHIMADPEGTLAKGVISFPAYKVYIGLTGNDTWYQANKNGTFKITLPGAASAPALTSCREGEVGIPDLTVSGHSVLKADPMTDINRTSSLKTFVLNGD